MEVKLFCDRVAKGELSKIDILKFAESVEDKVHLCWLLFCRMPSTKTARAETECERLSMAMAWIQTKYGFDWDGEYQDESTIKPIDECSELPKELQSDEAKELLERLVNNGYCEENTYKWKETQYEAAQAAYQISKILNLKCKWKIFEPLWGYKNMAQTFHHVDVNANQEKIIAIDRLFPENALKKPEKS